MVFGVYRKRQYQAKHEVGKQHHYEDVDNQKTSELLLKTTKFNEIISVSEVSELSGKPVIEEVRGNFKSESEMKTAEKSSMKNVLYEPGI